MDVQESQNMVLNYISQGLLNKTCWVVVAHTFNPSTWEAEAGGFLWGQGQPGLQSKFQDSPQSYRETLSWKTKTKQKQNLSQVDFCIWVQPGL